MTDRLLENTALAETVRRGLELAASARGELPLSSTDLLVALARVDHNAEGWARLALHTRAPDRIEAARWPDPDQPTTATWNGVPLTASAAKALQTAERLSYEYELIPLSVVTVALGLIADPASGAGRALVSGTGTTHAELVELVQEALGGGRFVDLDLSAPVECISTSGSEPSGEIPSGPAPPPRQPAATIPLHRRWDWPRVRSLLYAAALAYFAVGLATGVPTTLRDDGIISALTFVVVAAVFGYFAARHLRRGFDATAVAERKAIARRRAVNHDRNVAARPTGHWLTAPPSYDARALDLLRRAADLHPAATTTRAHVATALADDHPIPAPADDGESATPIVLNHGADALVLLASDELASCLADAERLAQSYAMRHVEPGHLAAAVAHSATGDLGRTQAFLRQTFHDHFHGLESVLVPVAGRAPTASATPPPLPLPPSVGPGVASPPDRMGSPLVLRASYLVLAALLLLSLGGLIADVPARVRDAGRIKHGERALHDGRHEDAYRLFALVARAEPRSFRASEGMACAAAQNFDLDRWADAEEVALWMGMPLHFAGTCLAEKDAASFHLVVADQAAMIMPAAPPADRAVTSGGPLKIVRTTRSISEVAALSSCQAGPRRLLRLAEKQARFALETLGMTLADPEVVVAILRRCLPEWPAGEVRTRVEGWVS
jgi:hypothetical protein